MPTPRLALKLTSNYGTTFYGGKGSNGIRLKVGMRIKAVRPIPRYARGTACNQYWVHAYKSLRQALDHDHRHCGHGYDGIVWLIRLYGPTSHKGKLTGTSYTVLRKIGRMEQVDPKVVAALLKGKK